MAKTVTLADQANMPQNGRWVWKEDTCSLEYLSNNPAADKRKGNRGQRPGFHIQEHGHMKKMDNRGATPSIGSRAHGFRAQGITGHKTPPRQTGNKNSGDHTNVTLEDVKSVAFNMLSEVDTISQSFEGMFGTEQFDQFLLCLLNFFHWYFEKKGQEEKPNPMNIEPSLRELRYYEDLCVKLQSAGKLMGQAYSVLVLGIGLQGQHHMACGSSRVSSTYKDRSMYETLYSYCVFVVWIAFKRKDYESVKKEIGRMLRSDTFNPAIRVKLAPDESREEETEKEEEKKDKEKKLTPAEYRRLHGNRPPIKSIINQRSPALVSILPSPKEESHWLFRRKGALSPTSLGKIGKESEEDEEEELQDLHMDFNKLKIGIIGEPLKDFNPVTLTPLGAENEEENEEEAEKPATSSNRRESQIGGSTSQNKTPKSQDAGLSREVTGVSQVTQEALSDED